MTRLHHLLVVDLDDRQSSAQLEQLGEEARRVGASVLHDDERKSERGREIGHDGRNGAEAAPGRANHRDLVHDYRTFL